MTAGVVSRRVVMQQTSRACRALRAVTACDLVRVSTRRRPAPPPPPPSLAARRRRPPSVPCCRWFPARRAAGTAAPLVPLVPPLVPAAVSAARRRCVVDCRVVAAPQPPSTPATPHTNQRTATHEPSKSVHA